ncbi:MAG: aldehyde dehydrogenase family protein, partial [Calditrichales bacterium]
MGNISTNMAPHGTPCINPASGEIIGYAPLNSVADLKRSIVQAREAQKEWAAVPIHQRVKKIRKIGT